MTELLIGTKKGLFVLEGAPGSGFEVKVRAFAGEPVDYVTRDRRTGRLLATMTSPFYGPKIFYTDDPAVNSGSDERPRPRMPYLRLVIIVVTLPLVGSTEGMTST